MNEPKRNAFGCEQQSLGQDGKRPAYGSSRSADLCLRLAEAQKHINNPVPREISMPALASTDHPAEDLEAVAGKGGCFPIHLDSDETVDSRRVTAIVYLNNDWVKKHGGQLRLYPSWDKVVDIEPINDRMVIFSSCRMPHR